MRNAVMTKTAGMNTQGLATDAVKMMARNCRRSYRETNMEQIIQILKQPLIDNNVCALP